MALLGDGALVFWHDVAREGRADFEAWHAREHMAERVGVPGFRRGRRYHAVEGGPGVFMLYEVDDLAVLTSAPYLARLDDPTPWTRRALGYFRAVNRTLCRVTASHGTGLGGFISTLRVSPPAGRSDALRRRLVERVLPEVMARDGVVGAHLLEGDPRASRHDTEEKRLRRRPDEVADWVVLVEAGEAAALAAALPPDALAPASRVGAVYQLAHALSRADLGG